MTTRSTLDPFCIERKQKRINEYLKKIALNPGADYLKKNLRLYYFQAYY